MTDATDNFNRAALGSDWTLGLGSIVISGSTVVVGNNGANDNSMWWNADSFDSDHYSEVVYGTGGADGGGPAVRHQSGADTFYAFLIFSGSGATMYEVTAGSFAALGAAYGSGSFGSGQTVRLDATGSTLTPSNNGGNLATRTDSSITGGSPGIELFGTTVTVTDWLAGPIAAGAIEVDAEAGSYTVTGTAANLEVGHEVVAAAGSYAVSGTVASLELGHEVAAEAGSYTVSGQNAGLSITDKIVVAELGAYAVSGAAASLEFGHEVVAGAGSYAVSGQDATLIDSGAADPVITIESGSFAVSGANVSLEMGREIVADAGNYAVSGTAATLEIAYEVAVEAGSYLVGGSAAVLTYSGGTDIGDGAGMLGGEFFYDWWRRQKEMAEMPAAPSKPDREPEPAVARVVREALPKLAPATVQKLDQARSLAAALAMTPRLDDAEALMIRAIVAAAERARQEENDIGSVLVQLM